MLMWMKITGNGDEIIISIIIIIIITTTGDGFF